MPVIVQIMETFYVEAALVKIASLTKVALGDAGMDILSVNLKGSEFNRKFGVSFGVETEYNMFDFVFVNDFVLLQSDFKVERNKDTFFLSTYQGCSGSW